MLRDLDSPHIKVWWIPSDSTGSTLEQRHEYFPGILNNEINILYEDDALSCDSICCFLGENERNPTFAIDCTYVV